MDLSALAESGLFYPVVGVLSLLVGSFLNVVVHRLPIMMENDLRLDAQWLAAKDAGLPEPDFTQPTNATYNLATPRSSCPRCDSPISARDNIPVLSWLMLKGRCRHCDHPISVRYPLVEATTAILSLLVAWIIGPQPAVLLAIPLVWTCGP